MENCWIFEEGRTGNGICWVRQGWSLLTVVGLEVRRVCIQLYAIDGDSKGRARNRKSRGSTRPLTADGCRQTETGAE